MNEKNKTDELFRNALFDYNEELPSNNTEEKVFWLLNYYRNSSIFKISLGIFIIALPLALFAYLLLNKSDVKQHNAISQTIAVQKQLNHQNIKVINQPIKEHKLINKNNSTEIQHQITENNNYNPEANANANSELNSGLSINETSETAAVTEVNSIQTPSIEEAGNANEYKNLKNITELESLTVHELKQTKSDDLRFASFSLSDKIINDENNELELESQSELIKKIIVKPYKSFSIEVSANYFDITKKLSASHEFDAVIQSRISNENKISSFSPGVEFRFDTKKLFFQTGINYQQYGEKINYNINDIERNINSTLLHSDSLVWVIDSLFPGESHWEYDTSWYTVYDTAYNVKKRNAQHTNTYNYFEIPVLIGKSFAVNRFIIDISAGFSFGILLKANAILPSADNNTILNIENRNSSYLNDLQLNYILRLALRYQMNENWSVFIRPSIKKNLGSILNQNKYPVEQKYTLYGLGMGIMYTF